MKVVLLTSDAPNQLALAHKLAANFDLQAIVLSRNIPRKQPRFFDRLRRLKNRIGQRLVGLPLVRAWYSMQAHYAALYPDWPKVPITRVRNINDPETIGLLSKTSFDLIIVSGTNLVGKKIIAIGETGGGIVNLHTGISPYVKGGPNCTNWALAMGWFDLIGNTVMWIDPGVDTGPIITTERTPLDGTESLAGLQWKVMEHAHELYVRAVQRIAVGPLVPKVYQASITTGRSFLNIEWTPLRIIQAQWKFRQNYRRAITDLNRHGSRREVVLISLPEGMETPTTSNPPRDAIAPVQG